MCVHACTHTHKYTHNQYVYSLQLEQQHFAALQAAERHLRASGLRWTVVRPGGLMNEPASAVGRLIVRGEDSLFGLDTDPGRAISRDTVCGKMEVVGSRWLYWPRLRVMCVLGGGRGHYDYT